VYQATLARHLAQGGDAADELTTEQFHATIEGFRKVQETMQRLENATKKRSADWALRN
jgi:hypothetical protein